LEVQQLRRRLPACVLRLRRLRLGLRHFCDGGCGSTKNDDDDL
jgi:hypothetical protein